jgi:hypothetical protein
MGGYTVSPCHGQRLPSALQRDFCRVLRGSLVPHVICYVRHPSLNYLPAETPSVGIATLAMGGMSNASAATAGGGAATLMAAIYCKMCVWLAANWLMATVTSVVIEEAFVAA